MIVFYFIILSLNVILSQTSSLSLYGTGERIYSFDAHSISIGDSRLFTSNSSSFTLSSPSTYYKNNQANLSMSVGFNKVTSNSIDEILSNNFHFISFGFPVTDNQYFMLSVNPKFRSDIILYTDFNFIGADASNLDFDEDGEDDPMKYRNIYDLSGGISEINSSFSSKINNNISLGFKAGKLFGTSTIIDSLFFHAVDMDIDGNLINLDNIYTPGSQKTINKYNYSSTTYQLDMRFQILKKSILAFYFGQSDYLDVNVQSFKSNLDLDYEKKYEIKGYTDFGIGFQSNVYDNFGYILEFQKYDGFRSLENVNFLQNPDLDMRSYNIGTFMVYDDISNSKINSINLNLGFYDKLFKINNRLIDNDLGITLGIGINYLNNNSFAISLASGNRNSEYNEFKNEKYYKLTFSFISNTMWFIKEGD